MDTFDWKMESEKQWDSMAPSWNSRSRGMWESGSRKDIVPFIKQFVPEGSLICDLGCADGTGSEKLAEAGYLVTGIDLSEEMLERARLNPRNEHCFFNKVSLSDCGSPDNYFDAVMAINSIEWTNHPNEALSEMARILKPNGYACIGILGPTAGPRTKSFRRLYGEEVICNTIMPWELERLAMENGWRKAGEFGVFKKAAEQVPHGSLPAELQQALSFMWVFMFQVLK
ncbi:MULTISPECIES: class I SAM-dependent methyltransferase [unclassified Bacillus (in: firmicutes)]|uniref:class I SAM-dependent methyltransferase n=1 Tax=unclassified Bacillus (in: firmicutes) TaxID=185979 RepID=UPI001BE740A2|nr:MULTISPECIES: class I SAM-dependent methyltransferase [unclassified Bacillus (in: firmicutes)]MBT2641964.1 class I SAM-dependent methyltransferase [Bacillus sp. ISL-41]MBT2662373.1 class I SAM-dependent methyltransferase [Bacillus sp. ISL-45]